jgi:hypothetical protein
VHQRHAPLPLRAAPFPERRGQSLHWPGHCWVRGLRGLAFHDGKAAPAIENKKTDLQPLFVAEVVKLWPLLAVDLRTEQFRRKQALKQRAAEPRFCQFRRSFDSQQAAGKAQNCQAGLAGFTSRFPR